jgi:cytochrome c1
MRPLGVTAAIVALAASAALVAATRAADRPRSTVDEAAIARGKAVFSQLCHPCHSLRYRGERTPLSEREALAAYGKVPPDLSLMALARGREQRGADYIAGLLTAYEDSPARNRVFPGIAMPAPLSAADPDLRRKAGDVASYLLFVADPHAAERRRLGYGVLGYLGVLAGLLFLVNRRTWVGLRSGGGAPGADRTRA